MSLELVLPSEGQQALAKASTIGEIRRIIGQAKNIEEEARAVRKRLAAVNGRPEDIKWLRDLGSEWASIRIEAASKGVDIIRQGRERGEVLKAEDAGPGRGKKTVPSSDRFSLADLSLTKQEFARWRAVHEVDYVGRHQYYDWAKEQEGKDGEITMAGLIRFVTEPAPVEDPPPIPDGKFRCLVIDPPWPMPKIERDVRPRQGKELDYPVMSIDQIAALPVGDLAFEEGCHVYLWVTHKFLPYGLELFEKWDVKYQCAMTWVKNVGITPYSWMYDTEHVLFGRVGNLQLDQLGLRLSFEAPVTVHSAKPDVFYERVLLASPGPRLEMFARSSRDGFEAWGNEVGRLAG